MNDEKGPALFALAIVRRVMPKNPAAIALGTLGGKSKSKKKTAAARVNGRLGGRPKKTVDKHFPHVELVVECM